LADWFLEDDAALAAESQLQVAKLAASMLDD
jgi:streptomycin 6-kinase